MSEIRNTEAVGVLPGDFLLRTAIMQFLADMRAQPDELDFIWAWYAQDELTREEVEAYGETQIRAAREWFLKTEIPVFHNVRIPDQLREQTFVTLAIGKDDEAFNTLGDSHWANAEPTDANQPFFGNAFTPAAFDVATGNLTLPAAVVAQGPLVPGVVVFTRNGREYPIVEIIDDAVVRIENNGLRPDLQNLRLRYPPASYGRELGGAVFRQTYMVGVHSYNEPIHGLYLYAIMAYGLMKYRKEYLEARGLQGSQLNIGPFDVDAGLGEGLGFSRIFQLQGLTQAVWAASPRPNILATATRFRVQDGGNIPVDVDIQSINDLLWIGDLDGLGTTFGSVPQLGGSSVSSNLRIFFGVGPSTLSQPAEVEALSQRSASQRQTSFSVVAPPGQFIFCAMPVSFGDPIFQVGAFIGGFILVNGNVMIDGVQYRLYRSVQAGLGSTTVEVL